uniref:Contactin n=1 Tax=Arion vulgaris TaxID=1028688 RepID=A0A0B7AM68_9EUPU
MMGLLLFCLSTLLLWNLVYTQSCPSESGWVMYNRKCYNFVQYPRLVQQMASRACQDNGATLVSVNDLPEHQFIANWLQQNNQGRDSWRTSGMKTNDGVAWEGDGTVTTAFEKWIIPPEQRLVGQRLVYSYQGTEFGWAIGLPDTKYCYICEISADEVYRILQQSRDFDYGLNVDNPGLAPRGPIFLQQPEETVILGKTNTVYLDCLASGNPEPTYEWLKDNKQGSMVPLPPDRRFSFTTGKLEITNPNATDETTYQCKATNQFGTILSTTAQLSFGFLAEFSNVPPAPVYGNEYDGAQLECPNIAGKPAKSYQWYKNNFEVIRPNQQKHLFISASGKLLFSEVSISDQGTYFCLITLTSFGQKGNYIGASQVPSRNSLGFNLNVRSGGASRFQPKIQNDFIYVFPPIPTREGTVSLECFAYGTGPFKYTWSRGGNKPLPEGSRLDSDDRILILYNVKLEDGGQYNCKVFSSATNLQDERSIDLVIQSKPYFTYALTAQHVDVGSRLTWHCEASGQPIPTYVWYKNGKVLTNSPGFTVTVNTLTIEAVDAKRDSGMYQCAATNSHGTTFSTAQLRVLELAPSFSKTPMLKSLEGALGGQITIICDPIAAPAPTYQWSKDLNSLNLEAGLYGQDDHYKLLLNGNLMIQNIVASDQGKYTCRAENSLGRAEDYSNLNLADSIVLSQYPRDDRVEVNRSSILNCKASHKPSIDMIYLWKFNDHIINYRLEYEYKLGEGDLRGSLYITPTQFRNEGRYTCIATTGTDQISASSYITVIGPPGEPAGVYVSTKSIVPSDGNNLINATNLNTTRWIIWTDGLDRGSLITHYFVEFRTNLDTNWRVHPDGNNLPKYSVTNEQYPDKRYARLTNLKAGAGIEFRVLARNSFGIGAPSLPTTITQIAGARPTAFVQNIRGGGGSVGELSVVWDPLPEEDHNGPNLNYKVSWRTYEASSMSDTSKWRSGEIAHGAACKIKTDYVSLRVPLGAPQTVLADVYNATALMITWSPVPNNKESVRGKLKGYKINYWRSQRETESQALQNIIELKPGQNNLDRGLIIGLEAITWYRFNVQIYNSAGNGPKSSDYDQQTLNRASSQYPTEVYVYSVEGFGVRVNFRGITTRIREEPLRGYKVQYWKSHENILSAKTVDFGKSNTGLIRNLSSSVLYELRVFGYSRGGQGQRSSPTVYFAVGDGQIVINSETTEILSGGPTLNPTSFIILITLLFALLLKL